MMINSKMNLKDFQSRDEKFLSDIKYEVSSNYDRWIKKLREFLNKFRKTKGDPAINIISRDPNGGFGVPTEKMEIFFKLLKEVNEKSGPLSIAERQLEYSGIMIDFDFYQKEGESCIDEIFIKEIISRIFLIILTLSNITQDVTLYTGIIKKSEVVYDEDKKCYKDGIHIIFPGFKCTRAFKKILIDAMKKDRQFLDMLDKFIEPAAGYKAEDYIDKNSAYVPVFFVGCKSKPTKEAYKLKYIYKVFYPANMIQKSKFNQSYVDIKDVREKFKKSNHANEFSINFQVDDGIIRKINYLLKDKYAIKQIKNSGSSKMDKHELKLFNSLSTQAILDPEIREIRDLAMCINPIRWDNYTEWIKMMILLKEKSEINKGLAEELSRKSTRKFNIYKFNEIWTNLETGKNPNPLTIKTLYKWAKEDNFELYEKVIKQSIFRHIVSLVYDSRKLGKAGHYDIAKILYKLLKHKFIISGERSDRKNSAWYEFVTEGENYKDGELYKWKQHNSIPTLLSKYISEPECGISYILKEYLDSVTQDYINASNDYKKYYGKIKNNLQTTCHQLTMHGYKSGINAECFTVFWDAKFYDKLDKNGNIFGVGNGVLELDTMTLHDGYHEYLISNYTKVKYKTFDPYNKLTKEIIIGLRNLFLNDEGESYEFIMSFLSTSLNGFEKAPLILFLVGQGANGKSWLMEMMNAVLGEYGDKITMSFITSKSGEAESASPQLMKLKNKRFVYASESNENDRLNGAKMKEITGNESITGRHLFQECETFIPHCIYVCLSNTELDIIGTDYGTWRRIRLSRMKIRFGEMTEIDKKNPREKEIKSEFNSYKTDPNALSCFLSILTWYYAKLQHNYNGNILIMPHNQIKKETRIYQNNQDLINKFINEKCVIMVDKNNKVVLSYVAELFAKWKQMLNANQINIMKEFKARLKSSIIQNYIVTENSEDFIKGLNFLDIGGKLDEGEKYFRDHFKKYKYVESEKNIKETPDEYYGRLCKDFDKNKIKYGFYKKIDKCGDENKYMEHEIELCDYDKIDILKQTEINRRRRKNLLSQYEFENIEDNNSKFIESNLEEVESNYTLDNNNSDDTDNEKTYNKSNLNRDIIISLSTKKETNQIKKNDKKKVRTKRIKSRMGAKKMKIDNVRKNKSARTKRKPEQNNKILINSKTKFNKKYFNICSMINSDYDSTDDI